MEAKITIYEKDLALLQYLYNNFYTSIVLKGQSDDILQLKATQMSKLLVRISSEFNKKLDVQLKQVKKSSESVMVKIQNELEEGMEQAKDEKN